MSDYAVWLYTPTGQLVAAIDDFLRLDYVRAVNEVGSLTLDLPYSFKDRFASDPLPVDALLAVYRTPTGGTAPVVDTETLWFARSVVKVVQDNGEAAIRVQALSGNNLLARRIVAYNTGSTQAKQAGTTELADNLMKRIVRQNLGSSASDKFGDTTRAISANLFSVQADASQGPGVAMKFAWRNVAQVLGDIAKDADNQGTPIYFDVVTTEPPLMEFRTYLTQRGVDHTAGAAGGPVTLSIDFGTLLRTEWGQNRLEEVTYPYAGTRKGGIRKASDLTGASLADSLARRNASPFNRWETFLDASMANNDAADAALRAELRRGRPKRHFTAEVLNSPRAQYGLHWSFGDRVMVGLETEEAAAFVVGVHVSVDGGKETISATLRADDTT